MKQSLLILAIAGALSLFACNTKQNSEGTENTTETNTDIGENKMDPSGAGAIDTAGTESGMDTARVDSAM